MYIIHNLPPDVCYKKRLVIPAGFILGPEKMKDSDSFLFPVLYHILALQTEGMRIWDSSAQMHIPRSTPFIFVTANGPVMAMISGMVRHSGKFGCCLYYGLPGCLRERDGHYYSVLLKPDAYIITGCDHDDVTFSDLKWYQHDISACYHNNIWRLLEAVNLTQFKDRHDTGLCKQTLLSGLRNCLEIPNIFPLDIINALDQLERSWPVTWSLQGTIKVYPPDNMELWNWCALVGNVWQAHGRTVALATPFIPSSFGCTP